MSGNNWEVFYGVAYTQYGNLTQGVGQDVALEAAPATVPEASTLSMLAGAALMGLGMFGYRRWFRKPEEEEKEEAEKEDAQA
jgi:hypothetical protein